MKFKVESMTRNTRQRTYTFPHSVPDFKTTRSVTSLEANIFLEVVIGYKKYQRCTYGHLYWVKWHVLSYTYQLQKKKREPFWRNLNLKFIFNFYFIIDRFNSGHATLPYKSDLTPWTFFISYYCSKIELRHIPLVNF